MALNVHITTHQQSKLPVMHGLQSDDNNILKIIPRHHFPTEYNHFETQCLKKYNWALAFSNLGGTYFLHLYFIIRFAAALEAEGDLATYIFMFWWRWVVLWILTNFNIGSPQSIECENVIKNGIAFNKAKKQRSGSIRLCMPMYLKRIHNKWVQGEKLENDIIPNNYHPRTCHKHAISY